MPDGIIIRDIKDADLSGGFLASLESLAPVGIGQDGAAGILYKIRENPNHTILVAVVNGRVAGSATLLIEPKFIHGGGLAGHIEDVVVDKTLQGRGIGKKLVLALLGRARKAGCYKTLLDCKDELRPFYEGLGFRLHSSAMRIDH